jgi:hypothetical protein
MRSPDGIELRLTGVCREIEPPARLVFTHAWLDADGAAGPETLVTVTLAEAGSGTRPTLVQSGFASATSRDGYADGWSQCLDRLAERLAALGRGRRPGAAAAACADAGGEAGCADARGRRVASGVGGAKGARSRPQQGA